MEVTLEQLLESRDRRHELQASLLRRYPRMTLVCVTVVMPGKEKRNQYSLAIAKSAMYALRTATTPLHILF